MHHTQEREQKIRRWLDMWLRREDLGILELFAPDAVYLESWGPEYHGAAAIRHWFQEWNTRGRVEVWDSGRFFHREDATIVEWRFRCVMNDGAVQTFDGLSLVEWTQEATIRRLQEFGCNLDTYDPYRNGDPPMFREERALWF